MAVIIPYLSHTPTLGAGCRLADDAAVIGRATIGGGTSLGPLTTVRADGERVDIGEDCTFLDRATVHIADGMLPTVVGARVTVGRYALVHACKVGDECVIADGAVVMDGAEIGAGAVIAAGALVPPGKQLDGGAVYAGNPARPVGAIGGPDREALRAAVIAGDAGDDRLVCGLPALDMAPFRPGLTPVDGPLFGLSGAAPAIDAAAYVAPTALVAGAVGTGAGSSIWFATVCRAEGAPITLGRGSNVQDNSILVARAETGAITIGEDVTVGHNVRMGACTVGSDCLIGMGSELGDGVVVEDGAAVGARALVEPGTVVESGMIWAGRPARAFRPLKPEERAFFRLGRKVYVGYAATYLDAA